jgi:hypothetical protein
LEVSFRPYPAAFRLRSHTRRCFESAHLIPWQVAGLVEDYAHYARGEATEVYPTIRAAACIVFCFAFVMIFLLRMFLVLPPNPAKSDDVSRRDMWRELKKGELTHGQASIALENNPGSP